MSKIIFMGTPLFAVPTLKSLNEHHEIVCVVTSPDKPAGRKQLLQASAIKQYALTKQLPVLTPTKVSDIYQELSTLDADYVVSCAYGQIIPIEILKLPKKRSLNVHASLLPKYRGAAPIQRAIMAGETEIGITIMEMAAGLDTGDMLIQDKFTVTEDDNYGTINERLSVIGATLIIKAIALIDSGNAHFIQQDESQATYANKILKADELIDFNQPTITVFNHIRALNPIPGALYDNLETTFKIYDINQRIDRHEHVPGKLVVDNKELLITTIDGYIVVKTLKLPNKGLITARDYLNQIK